MLIRRQISEENIWVPGSILIAAGGTAWADDITADVLTYDGKAKTVTATGNVVIHANEGAVVTGKKASIILKTAAHGLMEVLSTKKTRLL